MTLPPLVEPEVDKSKECNINTRLRAIDNLRSFYHFLLMKFVTYYLDHKEEHGNITGQHSGSTTLPKIILGNDDVSLVYWLPKQKNSAYLQAIEFVIHDYFSFCV